MFLFIYFSSEIGIHGLKRTGTGELEWGPKRWTKVKRKILFSGEVKKCQKVDQKSVKLSEKYLLN